jgi:para-nitrobenzyl esterase
MRFLLLILTVLTLASCATAPPLPMGQVRTTQGIVQGSVEETPIMSWLGIEYARAQRWQLPQSGPNWQGLKLANALGPSCPQSGQAVMVEDCLFLNVYAPKGSNVGARLPVVVWFHGGGFRSGSGGAGPKQWAQDGMIVVTFNYRLGLLGFRDWPGWDQTDPRNFGQADMVAALKWVQSNIENFGGDKSNVTLFGHSAGGMAVQLMMTDARAQGLFARAIADAAYASWPFPVAANPTPDMRMLMRYGPLETSASAQELVARVPHFHLPYVGGVDLKADPLTLLRNGPVRPVPMITGFTSFDGGTTLSGAGFTPDDFLARFGRPDKLRSLYGDDFAVNTTQGAQRVFGDRRYGVSARQSLRAVAGRDQAAWGFYVTGPTDNRPGVDHGGYYRDLFAAMPQNTLPMATAFKSFIKTGRPDTTMPNWSRFVLSAERWMIFTPEPELGTLPIETRLDGLAAMPFEAD